MSLGLAGFHEDAAKESVDWSASRQATVKSKLCFI
jgi:hypothetical protein